jgi:AcrR family transcriptional regulator
MKQGSTWEQRQRIMDSMLELAGEKGYREASLAELLDRCGLEQHQFSRHFEGKADCFAAAYEDGIERLCDRMLRAGRQAPCWSSGLSAALGELAEAIAERPREICGLLSESHVAGDGATAKREEILRRFYEAADRARDGADRKKPPPDIAAPFIVGAVRAVAARAAAHSKPALFADAVPDLAEMIRTTYLGRGSAEDEAARAAWEPAFASGSRASA